MYAATMLAPNNVETEIAHNGQAARIEEMLMLAIEEDVFAEFFAMFFSLKIEIVEINAFKKEASKIKKIFCKKISQTTICFNNSKSCNGSLYNSKKNERIRVNAINEIINNKK